MPDTPEPTDPRYLDEVLRFLYEREKLGAYGGPSAAFAHSTLAGDRNACETSVNQPPILLNKKRKKESWDQHCATSKNGGSNA